MKTKNEILDGIIKEILFDNYMTENKVPSVIIRMTLDELLILKSK